jgi:tetratricopeptide (TPR) repeat protein
MNSLLKLNVFDHLPMGITGGITMKVLILLSIIFSFQATASYEGLDDKTIEKLEKAALKVMERSEYSSEKQFVIYNLAARELYRQGKYKWAKKYYEKAIGYQSTKKTLSKKEAYYGLLSMAVHLEREAEIEEYYGMAKKYFEENPTQVDNQVQNLLVVSKLNYIIKDPLTVNDVEDKDKIYFQGSFGKDVLKHQFIKAVKQEKFSMAYKMLSQKYGSDMEFNTVRDIFKVMYNKDGMLHCQRYFDRAPSSISYTVKTCQLLMDFKNGAVKKEQLSDYHDFLKRHYPKKTYFYYLTKGLKK